MAGMSSCLLACHGLEIFCWILEKRTVPFIVSFEQTVLYKSVVALLLAFKGNAVLECKC